MKEAVLTSLAVLVFAATSVAQSPPAPAPAEQQDTASAASPAGQSQPSDQLPAGMIIPAELSKSVNAKKAKPGDRIEARTAMDLLSQGKIIVSRNTKIIGHVTEAKAHTKESPDSRVGIVFDRIAMKGGRELRLQAAVQAIARPLRNSLLMENDPMGANSGIPPAATATQGGDMGGSMPSRMPERVSSFPPTVPSAGASPDRGTVAALGPTSQGVVGMKGISLSSSEQSSVISSDTDNVHLDSGTQLILRTR